MQNFVENNVVQKFVPGECKNFAQAISEKNCTCQVQNFVDPNYVYLKKLREKMILRK